MGFGHHAGRAPDDAQRRDAHVLAAFPDPAVLEGERNSGRLGQRLCYAVRKDHQSCPRAVRPGGRQRQLERALQVGAVGRLQLAESVQEVLAVPIAQRQDGGVGVHIYQGHAGLRPEAAYQRPRLRNCLREAAGRDIGGRHRLGRVDYHDRLAGEGVG